METWERWAKGSQSYCESYHDQGPYPTAATTTGSHSSQITEHAQTPPSDLIGIGRRSSTRSEAICSRMNQPPAFLFGAGLFSSLFKSALHALEPFSSGLSGS